MANTRLRSMSHFALLIEVVDDARQNSLILVFMIAGLVIQAPAKAFAKIRMRNKHKNTKDKSKNLSDDIPADP